MIDHNLTSHLPKIGWYTWQRPRFSPEAELFDEHQSLRMRTLDD